ncbi:MAG: endonuclease/exonuclease/phosphatase family protein [Christensenellaceae bacterium]|nr:endonuclease/exonuclease/phosphatase family protein [Christensenellaceae bacterium]
MRIATYNVWNDERGGDVRQRQIVEEIVAVNADVIGLQEVHPALFRNRLAGLYPHAVFRVYEGEDEGLAILSRYPVLETTWLHELPEHGCSAALNVMIEQDGRRVSVTSLHLPWDSAMEKEKQIVAIDRFAHGQETDVCVLLGDFNGTTNSSVHRFLTGEQTLLGCEARPYWYELSGAYAAVRGQPLPPTLDFLTNPRWGGRNSTEIPFAADRIYVMLREGMDDLRQVALFGTSVSPESGYAASDHYGVAADVSFG